MMAVAHIARPARPAQFLSLTAMLCDTRSSAGVDQMSEGALPFANSTSFCLRSQFPNGA
jgi:hypothetical protein